MINGAMYFVLALLFILQIYPAGAGERCYANCGGRDGTDYEDICRGISDGGCRLTGHAGQPAGMGGGMYPTGSGILFDHAAAVCRKRRCRYRQFVQ